tara:strand:- start:3258 stop:3404 length:147 start_codon:yes stop_codon:yes gene_type:complete
MKLLKNTNNIIINKNIRIEKPKIQPTSKLKKLEYKYFIEMHRTVWKIY